MINAQGYINKGDGTREHQIIAEHALGRKLKRPEEVHHVDGIGSNNVPFNLVVCPNRAYHMLLHRRQRAMDACGNPNFMPCQFCKKYDDPKSMSMVPKCYYRHKACLAAYMRNYNAARR
jgi:hypothetical protein